MSGIHKNGNLCVVLLVGPKRIHAHHIVLAASSPYFRLKFTGDLTESKQIEASLSLDRKIAFQVKLFGLDSIAAKHQ